MANLRKIFTQRKGNFGHEGRPGKVGGSAPSDGMPNKPRKPVVIHSTGNGKPVILTEDLSYDFKNTLPNGKLARRFDVTLPDGTKIGRIEETSAIKDLKKTASGVSLDRRYVVGFYVRTSNEKYPEWERGMHTTSRPYALDWLVSRVPK